MTVPARCSVRVVVPHFFREDGAATAYGSTRRGNRPARSVALARCLGGVLALGRQRHDLVLNMAHQELEATPTRSPWPLQELVIDLHVFTTGDAALEEVIDVFEGRLTHHRLRLDDPRELPLTVVRWLLDQERTAALNLYLEDDLVIGDPWYLDKQLWFGLRTDQRCVLMPHRREGAVRNAPLRLLVDGPLRLPGQEQDLWACEEAVVARGRFWDGSEPSFVRSANPHSGSFCVSAQQLQQLRAQPWPPATFVGPLETAATGVLLGQFAVLKPSLEWRDFLSLEHGHPTFLTHLNRWPLRGAPGTP